MAKPFFKRRLAKVTLVKEFSVVALRPELIQRVIQSGLLQTDHCWVAFQLKSLNLSILVVSSGARGILF